MNFTEQEQDYYELILDMLDDGTIDESERALLNKRISKYGISDERAKEIEDFALQEIQNKNKPKFNTEGEEEYYELLEDMLDDGTIDKSERSLLNKRKVKYNVSDKRAKEFEDYIKSVKVNNYTILNSYNNNAYDLFKQGEVYYNDKNYEEAIKCFKKSAELEPNDWYNWNWLGNTYNKNGNYEEAIKCLKKAVELSPDNWSNWYLLGISYNENGNYEEAIRCFNKSIELDPNAWINWNWLGASYNKNGNYKEAIRCLNKAVELKPDDQSNWRWLGRSYNGNGEYEEAIRCLKKAVELMPEILNLFPKAKLHLWGDKEGTYKREIVKLVKKAGLENSVLFHGFEKNLDVIYKNMDVLLMYSRCEGFGRVTVEAMSYGIPVLGYDSGGTSELIKENVNGYLFKNPKELIDKLCLLIQDEKHFNNIRLGAYNDSRINYNIEKYCSNVENFINFIISRK